MSAGRRRLIAAGCTLTCLWWLWPALLRAGEPLPVLIDSDFGSDVDDAFALGLALVSKEVRVVGLTTSGSDATTRAWMLCRLLTATENDAIPVAAGDGPQPERKLDLQAQYRNHPDLLNNRTCKPLAQPAHEFLFDQIQAQPKKITLIALGPLTNVARLLESHPEVRGLIGRLVVSGGAIGVGNHGRPPFPAQMNFPGDPQAAAKVLAAEIPTLLVPSDSASPVKLSRAAARQMFRSNTLVANQVRSLQQLSGDDEPTLRDSFAMLLAMAPDLAITKEMRLIVGADGAVQISTDGPGVQVALEARASAVLETIVGRLGDPDQKKAPADPDPKIVADPLPLDNFPLRVHACEDYETDIERRWWLVGKPEIDNVPPGSRRACRGVLTHDFDDLQGNRRAMYMAVIFNPVPGPPMGPNTRLRFRYWLSGTNRLRVQLYSLSNGYHRNLTMRNLASNRWAAAVVDMTRMRRPDGSGGPLAADERIDDIQFYADPFADLIIDDVVLYEAGPNEEDRPFPAHIHFTGWFDTGKQGAEWPGDFKIVPHAKPLTWKAAQSVARPQPQGPWLQLGLRGARPLGKKTGLDFRYLLSGTKSFQAALVDTKGGRRRVHSVACDRLGEWSTARLMFSQEPTSPPLGQTDEVQFLLEPNAELLVDDMLLYEPPE